MSDRTAGKAFLTLGLIILIWHVGWYITGDDASKYGIISGVLMVIGGLLALRGHVKRPELSGWPALAIPGLIFALFNAAGMYLWTQELVASIASSVLAASLWVWLMRHHLDHQERPTESSRSETSHRGGTAKMVISHRASPGKVILLLVLALIAGFAARVLDIPGGLVALIFGAIICGGVLYALPRRRS